MTWINQYSGFITCAHAWGECIFLFTTNNVSIYRNVEAVRNYSIVAIELKHSRILLSGSKHIGSTGHSSILQRIPWQYRVCVTYCKHQCHFTTRSCLEQWPVIAIIAVLWPISYAWSYNLIHNAATQFMQLRPTLHESVLPTRCIKLTRAKLSYSGKGLIHRHEPHLMVIDENHTWEIKYQPLIVIAILQRLLFIWSQRAMEIVQVS